MRGTAGENGDHRLAVYGSLAPGRPNHAHVAGLGGRWIPGEVRGRLVEAGWAPPSATPRSSSTPTARRSASRFWCRPTYPPTGPGSTTSRGPGYERVLTTVRTTTGEVEAYIYVLSAAGPG